MNDLLFNLVVSYLGATGLDARIPPGPWIGVMLLLLVVMMCLAGAKTYRSVAGFAAFFGISALLAWALKDVATWGQVTSTFTVFGMLAGFAVSFFKRFSACVVAGALAAAFAYLVCGSPVVCVIVGAATIAVAYYRTFEALLISQAAYGLLFIARFSPGILADCGLALPSDHPSAAVVGVAFVLVAVGVVLQWHFWRSMPVFEPHRFLGKNKKEV